MKEITKFNYKEVKCNGVGGRGYRAVLKHKDQIQSICEEVRNSFRYTLWDNMIEHAKLVDGRGDYHPGIRYSKVEENVYRLATGIADHVSTYLDSDELIEMHVGAILDNLTMEEKVYMVLDALRDCASADHWYTFEKEWY